MVKIGKKVEKWFARHGKLLHADKRGEVNIGEIITAIVAIVVGALLVSALLPTSLTSIINSRNASWASGVLSSYDAIPIMAAVSGMLIFVAVVIKLTK